MESTILRETYVGAWNSSDYEQSPYDLYTTGNAVKGYFGGNIEDKQVATNYIIDHLNSTDLSVQDILKQYNIYNEIKFTTTMKRDDF